MADALYTRTAKQVADEVRAKFGDSTAVRLSNDMILTWVNNATRAIAQQNPLNERTAKCNIIQGQKAYEFETYFPDLRVQRYDMITVKGKPIEIVPFPEFSQRLADYPDRAATPTAVTEYGGTLTFWPTPDESIAEGIVLYFLEYPADVTSLAASGVGTLLTVPDRFYNAVVDYVHQQALEYDDNFEAAALKGQQFDTHMMREQARGAESPGDFYPVITDVEDDVFGPPVVGRNWRTT